MPYLEPGTITVNKETRERISYYKEDGESWDSVINEMLDYIEEINKEKGI